MSNQSVSYGIFHRNIYLPFALSVAEIAKKWNMSERSVRNYCAKGRVNGAFLTGKTWNLPENAEKPERINKRKEEPITLLDILKVICRFNHIIHIQHLFFYANSIGFKDISGLIMCQTASFHMVGVVCQINLCLMAEDKRCDIFQLLK